MLWVCKLGSKWRVKQAAFCRIVCAVLNAESRQTILRRDFKGEHPLCAG